jgi:DNA polymerase III epsilon subunit-like protein
MYNKLIFLDTETTGVDATDGLCQLAFKTDGETFCELYKPAKPIPPEASAVTHITNKMVADKPSFKSAPEYARIKKLLEDTDSIVVAHNAQFDVGMLAHEGIEILQYICTLKVARYLDKEGKLSQYKLQYLRYFLEIEIEAQAHDALGDVMVLEALFARLLKSIKRELGTEDDEKAITKMIEISSQPSLLRQFNFGKYSGKKIEEVAQMDPGYLEWLLGQKMQKPQGEEDWIFTLNHYLGK